MYVLRTRFGKEIVAEFLPPAHATKKQRVIIICGGMPGYPEKSSLLEFFSKKGFWVINPRYRGTWESSGKFLQVSLDQDVIKIIDALPKGFIDLWSKKKYKVAPDQTFILGASFGGAAALLASRDKRITKVIAISPVVDWLAPSKTEPLDKLYDFTVQAFGRGYAVTKNNFQKLKTGKFYNPVAHTVEFSKDKILIIHSRDDKVCSYAATKKFSTKVGSKLITLPYGGHMGTSIIMKARFYKIFKRFIND